MTDDGYHVLLKELPEEERPRERLQYHGAGALGDSELIAILLRTGSGRENAIALAHRLLGTFGGLRRLAGASIAELCEVPGIGLAKAAQLLAAFELGRRASLALGVDRTQVTAPAVAARIFLERLSDASQEHLLVMLLDTKHHLIRPVDIYTGSVNQALVRVGEVFREAVRENAVAVLIAHNHPSGDVQPSPEDLRLTEEVVRAGRLLDIEVLDHLIIGRQAHLSLKESHPQAFR